MANLPSPRPQLDSMELYMPGIKPKGGIKLSSNENPLGPSPKAIDAMKLASADMHIYADSEYGELLNALATQAGVAQDQVVMGNGSDELLQLLALAYVNHETNVYSAEHTFSEYSFVAKLQGARYHSYPMAKNRVAPENLLSQKIPAGSLVFICSPNNPTGGAVANDIIEGVANHCQGSLVVVDHAYYEYVDEDYRIDYPRILEKHPNLLFLRTFSKIYGLAGLRLGYGYGTPQVIANLRKVRQPFHINTMALKAGLASLGDHDFVAKSLELNTQGLVRLSKFFDSVGIEHYQTQGNFLCFRGPGAPGELGQFLLERKLAIRHLKSFGLPDHYRITAGTQEQLDRFEELLKKFMAKDR